MQNRAYTYDDALQLKDAGAIGASAAAQVGGSAQILDLGSGRVDGTCVLDVSAIEIDSSNEIYTIHLQGSNSATFASGIVDLAGIEIGHATGILGDTTSVVGRYELPFCNQQAGTKYRYLRAYTEVGGTVATGINYTAFVAKDGS